ncbi:hypothetical protein NC653_021354 [Populus alba x Populus x berolinensis]|uniref:TOD1/MUCI70 glycosyltransferase-like domain-containing protein n=1 Tax=Populus alba x Populus x berolinensis TaxID=444605 RepID=A0AAD6QDS7_9ROSI|nr:hypothetical protein NC653_021354 [Populus alba x Populus x berolinensis]
MGVHRLLPAVAPRGGRRLGRIFRPAISFRLWLLLLALLCLFSFAPFGLKFVILVVHGGSMESGISSSHQLHITGNIERFNEEVEQQQLHHSGYGGDAIKAPGRKHRRQHGHVLDNRGLVGLWKVVIARNLPYKNMRRTGKVPNFLSHRIFPSSSYSIWLDSKMRLNHDPMLIIEYFLWRTRSEYAISNHYDRHCVWEEVLQ